MYEELSEKLKKVSNEKDEISALAQQRQDAFLRTEEKYRDDMRALEVRLQKMGVEDRSRMDPLRNLHGNIQDTISSIQNKTARVLQDQERDLIRAFRARLADVTVELELERKRNESGSAEWVARCRKLTEELEWLRDLTDKLTSENKSVLKDNRRFKRQMKTQEEDREFLIKQLVSVKKENARLRYSFDQLMAGNVSAQQLSPEQAMAGLQAGQSGTMSQITGQPMSGQRPALRAGTPVTDASGNRPSSSTPFGGSRSTLPSRPQSAMVQPTRAGIGGNIGSSRPGTATGYASTASLGSTAGGQGDSIEYRYKAMVGKLQGQLEQAQKSYKALRTSYTAELASRTELQTFLKKCIDDVRQDMAERGRSATLRRAQGAHRATSAGASRTKQPLPPPLDPRSIPLGEFTPQDRISVMEWLMSQDQVIFMLYEKIFPQQGRTQQRAADSSEEGQNAATEFAASPIRQGQPGSLFYAPSQLRPASAAPTSSSSGSYVGSVAVGNARPQTVGPAGRAQQQQQSTLHSSGSFTASGSRVPSASASASAAQGSQWVPPLGDRPLSGFEQQRSTQQQQAQQQRQRPHTSSGFSSSAAAAPPPQQQQQQGAQQAAASSSSSSGLSEEERAESEYQRQQRALALAEEHGDQDDDGGQHSDDDRDDALHDGQAAGHELDPLSDEEDGDGKGGAYEHKEQTQQR